MNINTVSKLRVRADTKTARLPEALGIPATLFTVQWGTARFAVRAQRYKT
jgi:hypothetical protein